jgi:hypothetical protein
VQWRHSRVASVQVAQTKPESMPLVMRCLDSQHPFVTARTMIVFLMKVNDVLAFDAKSIRTILADWVFGRWMTCMDAWG